MPEWMVCLSKEDILPPVILFVNTKRRNNTNVNIFISYTKAQYASNFSLNQIT